MDIEKLKEEVRILEVHAQKEYFSNIIECALRVIDAAEVLPAKDDTKEIHPLPAIGMTYSIGYNRAIDECTAIVAKHFVRRDSLPTKEGILDLTKSYLDDNNEDSRIALTQAIAERLNK